ncbi:MAG TPA: iron ABC transporter permease [Gammaproteobacteria bacterium]|jgi:iron complex transport system permease protein|nr:iron ABC transporter permease [Gammaproteobacteria bacterium]
MTHAQSTLKRQYRQYKKRNTRPVVWLLLGIPVLVAVSIASGSADLSLMDVLRALFSRGDAFSDTPGARAKAVIVWELRLPRVIMGVISGFALGVAGAVMQRILRNPLADPYMLGIASAAGFGASLAIILGVGVMGGSYLIIGNAFFFSALASGLVLVFSGGHRASPEKMVLVGLSLLFFFQAMTTLLQYFGEAEAVKAAVFWTVGDLGKSDWSDIAMLLPIVILGWCVLQWKAADLNVLNSGDSCAKSLGVHVDRIRVLTMLVCTLMVAAVVSFTGTIGFVGLVAPHVVRMALGTDSRLVIPAAGLVGAVLLVLADTLARTLLSPVILPVGAVTAFLGVPLFLYLIVRKRSMLW